MYDRSSRSLWSQIDGKAMAGPMSGQKLNKIPSQVTTWALWKEQHPDTLVLVKPALERSAYTSYFERASWVGLPWARPSHDKRLPAKTLVLGVELANLEGLEGPEGKSTLAIPLQRLEKEGAVSGEVAGMPLWITGPKDPRAAQAYVRRIGDRILDIDTVPAAGDTPLHFVDRQTGSRWRWQTGIAVSGPLQGEKLPALPTTPIYWATWTAFHPETELW